MLKNLISESDLKRFKRVIIAAESSQEYWDNFIYNQFISIMEPEKLYSLNIIVMRESKNSGYGITDYPANMDQRIPSIGNSYCLILFIKEKSSDNQIHILLKREP